MSIKPRYSLFTFLALTAVIAVGVKLWHGPHHVIEQPSPGVEEEYSFTRDWHGNRVIHGVHIERHQSKHANRLDQVRLDYFRNGINTGNRRIVIACPPGSIWRMAETYTTYCGQTIPLNEQENQELLTAMELERTRIKSLGLEPE